MVARLSIFLPHNTIKNRGYFPVASQKSRCYQVFLLLFSLFFISPSYAENHKEPAKESAAATTPAAATSVAAAASSVASAATSVASAASSVKSAASSVASAASSVKSAAPADIPFQPNDTLATFSITVSMIFAVVGIAITLLILAQAKKIDPADSHTWLLTQALSEEIAISTTANTSGTTDTSTTTILVASSSRLIAFIGMIILVALLLGVTPLIIWSYGKTGSMPNLDNLSKFMVACGGLFLPYIANQARAALQKTSP